MVPTNLRMGTAVFDMVATTKRMRALMEARQGKASRAEEPREIAAVR